MSLRFASAVCGMTELRREPGKVEWVEMSVRSMLSPSIEKQVRWEGQRVIPTLKTGPLQWEWVSLNIYQELKNKHSRIVRVRCVAREANERSDQ